MASGSRLAEAIFQALLKGDIMKRHFPMLLESGVEDASLTVHSHFLTFFTTVGQNLEYAAVTECPITWARDYTRLGELRVDSVWFDRQSLEPRVAIEFERFERGDETKLRQKVENLAMTSLASPALELTLLVYWVRSGSAPRRMESIVKVYRDGFRRHGCNVPPATAPMMVVKCVMRAQKETDRLIFAEFLRDERNENLLTGRI